MRLEITCINKSNRTDPHERILYVGGKYSDGTRWKKAQTEVIQDIESRRHEFYVTRGGRTVNVIVAVSRYGHKYIKTSADGEHPDNLLSLPECL